MLMELAYLVLLNKEPNNNSPVNVTNVVEHPQPISLVLDVVKDTSFNLQIQQFQPHVPLVLLVVDVLNVNLILIVLNAMLATLRLGIRTILYVNLVSKIVLFVLIQINAQLAWMAILLILVHKQLNLLVWLVNLDVLHAITLEVHVNPVLMDMYSKVVVVYL